MKYVTNINIKNSKRFCFCVVAVVSIVCSTDRTDKANKTHSEPELKNLGLSISVFYTSCGEDKSGAMIAKDEVFGIQTFNYP